MLEANGIIHFKENRRPIMAGHASGSVNFPLCLAPMVGLSHGALRMVLREYLPPNARTLWPTEMLSSWKLPKEILGRTPETKKGDAEDFLVPQILGNEEEPIAESLKRLTDWGAEGIDINMGCPVQKALRHNYGVALMGDPVYAAEVVGMTTRNTKLPVSVKLRAVKDATDPLYLHKFVQGLIDQGASWICLHPRTAEQKRRGSADWEQIKWLRERIAIPVVGNGDIQVKADVISMLEATNCDLVMAGRALAARPWMMWQVGEAFGFSEPFGREGLRAPQTPEEEGKEYGRSLLRFIFWCRQFFSEEQSLRKIRFYVRTTHVWLDFGHSLLRVVTKAQNLNDLEAGVTAFFEQQILMVPHSWLRE